jgi:hypothetical protein
MEDVGILYVHLVYFTAIGNITHIAIWYILWSFGIFFPVLVCCTKKNLATLHVPSKLERFFQSTYVDEHIFVFKTH